LLKEGVIGAMQIVDSLNNNCLSVDCFISYISNERLRISNITEYQFVKLIIRRFCFYRNKINKENLINFCCIFDEIGIKYQEVINIIGKHNIFSQRWGSYDSFRISTLPHDNILDLTSRVIGTLFLEITHDEKALKRFKFISIFTKKR